VTFNITFKADEVGSLPLPKIAAGYVSSAGTFEGGLFSVLDEPLSSAVLDGWRWLLGRDAIALVASAFGDLFFWSEKHGSIYFLEVQRGTSTFVGKDMAHLFDRFLTRAEILDRVLHRERFKSVVSRLGKPKYRECYIAVPWARVGGSGEISTYTKGDLAVYASLVGQSVQQAMMLERSRTH